MITTKNVFAQYMKKSYCPPTFHCRALIHVVDYDKRKENKACEGAVGFFSGKEIKILSLYREFIKLLNVKFYPILEESVYIVDPCFHNLYIKLDEYFAYLKKVRVDELTKVAQDLGAKHVEFVLKSMQKSAHRQNTSGSFSARKASFKLGAEMSSSSSKNEYTGVEVAAKIDFYGNNNPVKPKLVYFKNESDIKALIDMRLNPNNKNSILSKTYTLQYGNSSGIKVSDAQKIDLALSQLNCSVGRSVASEAVSENSTILEYSIAF